MSMALVILGMGCAGDVTEIVVVSDTDLLVPSEVDEIAFAIDATAIGGSVRDARSSLSSGADLPAWVGVHHDGGDLGPVAITARARLGGAEVVSRTVRVSFVPGLRRTVRVDLLRGCAPVSCPEGESCSEEGCASVDVPATALEPWSGSADRRTPGDDCFGTNLSNHAAHCGGCGRICQAGPNVIGAECTGGACLLECEPGFSDCDGTVANGCEAELDRDVDDCGSCGASCARPGVVAECRGGACVRVCEDGTLDCNDDEMDGCEVSPDDDPMNCGACTQLCPRDTTNVDSAACVAGTCELACAAGTFDCNADDTDGCEATSFDTLENCGACGVRCGHFRGVSSCAAGVCELVGCDLGWEDCNGDVTDGCEQDIATSASNCGGCGVECPPDEKTILTASCTAGVCQVTTCRNNLGDCDMDASNGCETNVNSDRNNCGTCGNACSSGPCNSGMCR